MRYVSTKELDKCLDRIQRRNELPNRIINIEFRLLLPIVVVGSIVMLLLSKGSFLRFVLLQAAMLVVYLAVSFLLALIVSIASTKRLLRRISGGKSQNKAGQAFYQKYKDYYQLHKNDLCSDKLLEETERLLQAETDPALRFSLDESLLTICGYRLERERVSQCLEDARRDYDPEKNSRFGLLTAEINAAILTGNSKAAYDLLEKNEELTEWQISFLPEGVTDYAIFASICKRVEGDLAAALEYAQAAKALHERGRNILPLGASPTRTEHENYRRAAISLELAGLLFANGREQEARAELDDCDLIIADLKCEVPPLFIKEHQELIESMGPALPEDQEQDC
ncbi:MAG: hypothetical protein IJ071_11805 [Ruminococcus sp.]|nr:hypothetical protein [Ruminococcus sp.]